MQNERQSSGDVRNNNEGSKVGINSRLKSEENE